MSAWWQTFLVSMIPVVELRGAIPFGVTHGLSYWHAYGISVAGNVLVCAIVLALLIPIFKVLKKIPLVARFVLFFESRFKKQAGKFGEENEIPARASRHPIKVWLGLFIFAMLPVPLTGVWTASAIAVFLGLPYLKSLLTISAGAAVCGLLMVAITLLFGQAALGIFYFFALMAAIILVVFFTIALFRRNRKSLH